MTPGQQIIKVVHDEMTDLMGGSESKCACIQTPTVVMAVGLQGAAKPHRWPNWVKIWSNRARPLLVAGDIYRRRLSSSFRSWASRWVTGFHHGSDKSRGYSRASLEYAESHNRDIIILDTAGACMLTKN